MENKPKTAPAAAGGLLKSPFCSKLRTKNFYFLDRPAMRVMIAGATRRCIVSARMARW
jgi:hypothetical protein